MTTHACIGTVVSRSYVPFARVLVDSIREHHAESELDVVVCVVDGSPDDAPAGSAGMDASELLGGRIDMLERYSRQPLVVASKASLLRALVARGYERAVFLDADMLATARLDPLLDPALPQVVLTPHLLGPLGAGPTSAGEPGPELERIILLSGVFNGGCISIGAGQHARAMLEWLVERLSTHCRHDVANGLHFDQTWLDLVPGMFDEVHILRDPGVNVAYWNLTERSVTQGADGAWRAGETLLRLFHFSGFDPRLPDLPTRYRPALGMDAMGAAAALFEHYASRLVDAGFHDAIDLPSGVDATRGRLLERERAAAGTA